MPDGLGMLDEQRKRRSVRNIPASRNPPRRMPVEVVSLQPVPEQAPLKSDDNHPVRPTAPVPDRAVSAEARPTNAGGATAAPRTAPAKPAVQEPTIKMSIYLENSDDLYLEDITHAGKISRQRVAISRSAIVRLALQRLSETMTTDQIVDELRKSGDAQQGKGRKRR